MGDRRLTLLVGVSLCVATSVFAQSAPGEIEIEMEGDPAPADPPRAEPEAGAPTVEPDAGGKDPKVARKWQKAGEQLVKRGDQLVKQGKPDEAKQHYDNAVTAYQRAIEAGDDVALHYALAFVYDRAGRPVDSMRQLKIVLAAQGAKASLGRSAQAKLDELSMKVGIVVLKIEPAGAQVLLEGKEIGVAPLGEPLVLEPGVHTVTLTAAGFQPRKLDLKVEAGSESERKISLQPVTGTSRPPQVDEPEAAEPTATPSKGPDKRPLQIGVGATGGFVLIAAITGIAAIGKHGTATGADATPMEREDAKSSGETLALVTDLCIVGAIGAAAFTAYWYQYRYRPQARAFAERDAQAKVDVVPWVQPQAGGLSVAGSF